MKINGKYLARAIIYLMFFSGFLFGDTSFIDFEADFFTTLGQLALYIGILFFLGWKFTENLEETFA